MTYIYPSPPPPSLIFTEPSCAARCIKATSDQLHQSRDFMSKRKSVRLREGGKKKTHPGLVWVHTAMQSCEAACTHVKKREMKVRH